MQEALAAATRANDILFANRNDRWYPQLHIAARAGWLNDPNGLCHFDGRYHVFFQHHPASTEWGPMHWGHVSSPDLITWRREPIAFAPSIPEDSGGVWSGSAITADDGTLMIYYTGNVHATDDEPGVQCQILATSSDGVTFDKEQVVATAPGHGDFRDPKVWTQDGRWFMVVAARSLENRGQVWLYTSDDMRQWEFDRIIYEDPDPEVFMVECPDLFEIDGRWVLIYGPMTTRRPEGHVKRNGQDSGYVVGHWEPGKAFEVEHEYRPADWGHNFYAPQTFMAPDGRRILIGWMGSFRVPLDSQITDGWSGQLTVPRELSLDGDRLTAEPIREFAELRMETIDLGAFELAAGEERLVLDDVDAYEVELVVDLELTTAEQVGLSINRTPSASGAWVAYDDLSARIVLDRRTAGSRVGGYRSMPLMRRDELRLRVVVDRGSIEVFHEGEVLSSMNFPPDGPRSLVISAEMGAAAVSSLKVHRLGTIWETPGV